MGFQINFGPYLGEQVISGNDGSQAATLPAGTRGVWLGAEVGLAYYTINGAAAAQASSGGYVPEDSERYVANDNLSTLHVWAATGTKVHLRYEG